MSAHRWVQVEPATDADLRNVAALLNGAEFRAAGAQGAACGTVGLKDGALVLKHRTGLTTALSASACRSLEFAVSEETLSKASTAPDEAEIDRISILAACPPWARRVVAKHLMPRELAAFDRGERDARVASLQRTAALATGKPLTAAVETANPQRAARVAQLQAIGKAASASGNR